MSEYVKENLINSALQGGEKPCFPAPSGGGKQDSVSAGHVKENLRISALWGGEIHGIVAEDSHIKTEKGPLNLNTVERFLHYVSFDTQSDPASDTSPSTEKQKLLGRALADELKALGLEDAQMDGYGYVYAHLPATPGREDEPCLGLIAHMDTSDGASGANIKPRIVRYKGGGLVLNAEKNIVMDTRRFPFLDRFVGQDLIVTDGTTLLGADDKAGIAEIVSTVEHLLKNPGLAHGPLAVAFTTDEEIGRGTDHFDLERFGAKWAYTVDGGALGELNYENFNAAAAEVTVHGLNIHPGSAKDKMKNALLIATELIGLLPAAETPGHTQGREGFFHVHHMTADETTAVVKLLIRDHDRDKFRRRKEALRTAVEFLNLRHGEGTVEVRITDTYYNMREGMEGHMELVGRAKAAMRHAGVIPRESPVRGGTDGASLTYKGLPCPNLSTGGYNCHGVYETLPAASLDKMVEVLVDLVCQER